MNKQRLVTQIKLKIFYKKKDFHMKIDKLKEANLTIKL